MVDTTSAPPQERESPDKVAAPEASGASAATPMMAQFLKIKQEAGDALLFYRMGDFYELFFQDAEIAAAALDITLTRRGKHAGADIPMCGVPVVSSETYLSRLIAKGFRVAVCEQTEDPKEARKRGSKAVVARAIVRVVTPGTITEDTLLDARSPAWLVAVSPERGGEVGVAWADVTTGAFETASAPAGRLADLLGARAPREVLCVDARLADEESAAAMALAGAALTAWPATKFDARSGARRLKALFGVDDLAGLGEFSPVQIAAAGALVDYLELTQAGDPPRLSLLRPHGQGDPHTEGQGGASMVIDPATRASLELERTQRGARAGSLLATIDRTVSGPGARALAARLAEPSASLSVIKDGLDATQFFVDHAALRDRVRTHLADAGDPARALSRLLLGRAGPRDLLAVARGARAGELVSAALTQAPAPPARISCALDAVSLIQSPALQALAARIEAAIIPDAPLQARDGGFIARQVCAALDEALALRDESRRIIAGLQATYASRTGASGLKIKHNNVLGYFIELSAKAGAALLEPPLNAEFIHRQTMANAVRFSTVELGELESKIAGAADRARRREVELFEEMSAEACQLAEPIRALGDGLAQLDAAAALAVWAQEIGCVRPIVDDSRVFEIEAGRHPVVEAALMRAGDPFTPNASTLDGDGEAGARLTLVTGPNMAGKSTYLRQNALIAVLAQAGAFVPAARARIGVVDRLFSRVGAADDLARGRSTFMAEMIETAAIVNQAGPRALVILDEIGRGTATFDGLAIAWACAEHLHDVIGCRALFATHYHELTALADALPAGANVSLRAKEFRGELVFLHDVRPGPADRSYGIEVARRAGLPRSVVARARSVLKTLETEGGAPGASLHALPLFAPLFAPAAADPARADAAEPGDEPGAEPGGVSGLASAEHAAGERLRQLVAQVTPDELTPREALQLVYRLVEAAEAEDDKGA